MTPQRRNTKPSEGSPPSDAFADQTQENIDVQRIHMNIVGREKEEPEEGFEATPWWVWTASVVLLFAMGFYLGRYSGSFSVVAHEVEQPQGAAAAPVKSEIRGDVVYAGVCQACHQSTGLGVPGQYPPLVGSSWLLQDIETPVRIVLYGLQGEIRVAGGVYNNKMPQFHDKLSNSEIAAVLTHARSAWGNSAGPVGEAQVDSLRARIGIRPPWSAAELENIRKKRPS